MIDKINGLRMIYSTNIPKVLTLCEVYQVLKYETIAYLNIYITKNIKYNYLVLFPHILYIHQFLIFLKILRHSLQI